MNKYTLITLTVVLFSVFACKKDNEQETIVKQLKKAVITNPEGEVTTCNFKYQNDLISEIRYDRGGKIFTNTYMFNDQNQIQTIVYTDGDITRTTSFKYEDNRIIQTSDVPESDSVIFTLDGFGKVIKEEIYEFNVYKNDYQLYIKSDFKWTGKNVTGINYVSGTGTTLIESDIALTFDTNPNPMCFFQNVASMSDYIGAGLYDLIYSKNNILSEYTIFEKNPDDYSRSDYIYTYEDGYPVTLDIKTADSYNADTYHAYITYEYY